MQEKRYKYQMYRDCIDIAVRWWRIVVVPRQTWKHN